MESGPWGPSYTSFTKNIPVRKELLAGPFMTLKRYAQCIRPFITYGCLIWGNKLKAKHIQQMAVVQRMALMQCGNFRHGMPRDALNMMFGLIPLHLHIKELITKAFLRLEDNLSVVQDTVDGGHWNLARKKARDIGVTFRTADVINPPVQVGLPNYVVDPTHDSGRFPDEEDIAIFTDGSRFEDGDVPKAGSGVVIYDYNTSKDPVTRASFYLGNLATVYQAELYAIIKAVPLVKQYLTDNDCIGTPITLYVDNQSALTTLANKSFNTKLSLRCRNALQYLSRLAPVKLCWVKAHVGFYGNEEADRLAKEVQH